MTVRHCIGCAVRAAAAALLFVGVARASEPPRDRWAVLIGRDAGTRGVVASQHEFGRVLTREFGYRDERVIELFGSGATQGAIRDQLAKIFSRVGRNDTLIVYLMLPWRDLRGEAFLEPELGSPSEPWTLLPRYELDRLLGTAPARSTLVIMPDCDTMSKPVEKRFYEQTSVRPSGAPPATRLTFCTYQDESHEQMAAFARALVTAMSAGAQAPGGRLTIDALAQDLRQRLRQVRVPVSLSQPSAADDFAFVVEQGRLNPYIGALRKAQTAEEKQRGISDLVNAVQTDATARVALGSTAADAVKPLATSTSESPEVRIRALRALGELKDASSLPLLRDVLKSREAAAVRKAALEAIVQIGGPATLGDLTAATSDPAASIRVAAITALAVRRDLATPQPMLDLLGDSSIEVQVAALQALSLTSGIDRRGRQAVRAKLQSPSPEVRREAVGTLARIGESVETDDILAMLKNDPDVSVRQTIALSIGRAHRPARTGTAPDQDATRRAVAALIAVLQPGEPPPLREAAGWALGEIGGTEAERRLIALLDDRDAKVRRTAAEGLGKLRNRNATDALIRHLEKDEAPDVRVAAATALGNTGDPAAISPLLNLLKADDIYVRQAADAALASIRPSDIGALSKELRDESPKVRSEAVQRLGASRNPNVVPELIRMLVDDEPQVADTAASALASFRDPESLSRMVPALDDPSPRIRQGIASALGNMGIRDNAAALTKRLGRETNAAVRIELIRALGLAGRGDTSVADALIAASRDPDPAIRQAVAEALGGHRTSETRDALVRLSEDPIAEVRLTALQSLRLFTQAK